MSGKRVLIIGGVALGPKAACRLKRLEPDADVTMIDQDEYISYGGCGTPYFISGDINDVRELMSTSYHMLRTPQFFRDAKDIRVRTRTRALAIDRANRTVRVRDLNSGVEEDLHYDRLVIATGSIPNKPPTAGIELPEVITVSNLHSAIAVRNRISGGNVDRAVVVGAGAIGCEMAEALGDLWEIETHLVEIEDQVLPGMLDRWLADIVRTHLEEKGLRLHLGCKVTEIRKNEKEGSLEVIMSDGRIRVELIIAAAGVRPNTELARKAELLCRPPERSS